MRVAWNVSEIICWQVVPGWAKKFLYVSTVGQGGCGRQRYGSIQWTAVKVRLPAGGFWKHGQEGFALLEGVWRGNAYWSGYGARVLPCSFCRAATYYLVSCCRRLLAIVTDAGSQLASLRAVFQDTSAKGGFFLSEGECMSGWYTYSNPDTHHICAHVLFIMLAPCKARAWECKPKDADMPKRGTRRRKTVAQKVSVETLN